jgi:NMD protein affecting ribosome stability and mRNA decay|tara:strand:- start:177 stop:575 length:399 start_codon:yes stop_codon:yes gene_type:complete
MKILKYLLASLFIISMVDGNQIQKDGIEITTFTKEQALEMIKARDAQWKGKIEKSDSLIASQKEVIDDSEELILELQTFSKVDSVLSAAKSRQIKLLKTRDEANEKMIKVLEPKWYENTYLWLVIGFILGKV